MIDLLKLARLTSQMAIVSPTGTASPVFLRLLNDSQTNITAIVNQLVSASNQANSAALMANTASNIATTANTVATSLTTSTSAFQASMKLLGSYCDPNAILTSISDTSGSATISVAPHTRHYADGTSASVAAGSIPNLATDTRYFVTYDDPNHTGGTVTYQATTSLIGETGTRHAVGWIMTSDPGSQCTGHTVPPPGIPPLA